MYDMDDVQYSISGGSDFMRFTRNYSIRIHCLVGGREKNKTQDRWKVISSSLRYVVQCVSGLWSLSCSMLLWAVGVYVQYWSLQARLGCDAYL